MKDKNLAAVLAFFGGGIGLHRFYLGQIGLGVLYLIFAPIAWLIGVIDAIVLLSMDEQSFNYKYNNDNIHAGGRSARRPARPRDRYERYRQREMSRKGQQRYRSGSGNSSRRSSSPRRGVNTRSTRPAAENRGMNTGGRQPQMANPDRDAGIKYFKDFDYEAAIKSFEKALRVAPQDIPTHWNLACAYSLTEDADKSLYHLDRAVALGFKDFERIRTHDALAYVRIQPNFLDFQKNDYRLAPDLSAAPPPEEPAKPDLLSQPLPNEDTPRTNSDLLDQLQRLGQLRDKGLLTEAEFAAQKRKLLG